MASDGSTYTPVPEGAHAMIKSFAAFRKMKIGEAYGLVVAEGLKALGFDPAKKINALTTFRYSQTMEKNK